MGHHYTYVYIFIIMMCDILLNNHYTFCNLQSGVIKIFFVHFLFTLVEHCLYTYIFITLVTHLNVILVHFGVTLFVCSYLHHYVWHIWTIYIFLQTVKWNNTGCHIGSLRCDTIYMFISSSFCVTHLNNLHFFANWNGIIKNVKLVHFGGTLFIYLYLHHYVWHTWTIYIFCKLQSGIIKDVILVHFGGTLYVCSYLYHNEVWYTSEQSYIFLYTVK